MPTSLDLDLIGNCAISTLNVINRVEHLPTAWGTQP